MTDAPIFVLDPDAEFAAAVTAQLTQRGLAAQRFDSAERLVQAVAKQRPGCIILSLELEGACGEEFQGRCGLELQRLLDAQGQCIPLIFVSRQAEVPTVVRAMRCGAQDFLQKPVDMEYLHAQVLAAMECTGVAHDPECRREQIQRRLATLTDRENEVLNLALTGKSNKEISRDLDISPRTVETHRAHIMEKVGISNLLELTQVYAAVGRYFEVPASDSGKRTPPGAP